MLKDTRFEKERNTSERLISTQGVGGSSPLWCAILNLEKRIYYMKNWLQKIMYGRYGVDHLSNAMLIISVLVLAINIFTKIPILNSIVTVIIVISYFRMFSKNINKRYQENMKFLKWWNPIKGKFNKTKKKVKQSKTHKFFKCPGCSQDIRVPKGKGRIKIRCPKCNEKFEART